MKLRRTLDGPVLERDGDHLLLDESWDDVFRRPDPVAHLRAVSGREIEPDKPLAPIVSQEVWAAGVTYYVSRDARMEESAAAGTSDVYDRVYDAERPELFFKATPHRVVGPGEPVRIRSDSAWNVPEPELTLAVTADGRRFGYTIGNDMSSRDIEGENPLYLPQAKTYDGCAALGPELLVTDEALDPGTRIELVISRHGGLAFEGGTEVSQIKRSLDELVEFLTRETTFPYGCFLMTGAGVVPPSTFTLEPGDVVSITIGGIGTLTNVVG
ncbi:MAG: fumarylacetoacetate hydrolase family protein [Ilumatobacteraceae bacterium]